jgi:C4-dicarboxylate-specific signal transduction histidine kinase
LEVLWGDVERIVCRTRRDDPRQSVLIVFPAAEHPAPGTLRRLANEYGVILNLMINAVEAMSGDGGGARELLISTAKTESDVLVAVRDSGPGFAPENVDRIFESFYTTKPEGLGIGLSICSSIIGVHGGRLWASAN